MFNKSNQKKSFLRCHIFLLLACNFVNICKKETSSTAKSREKVLESDEITNFFKDS